MAIVSFVIKSIPTAPVVLKVNNNFLVRNVKLDILLAKKDNALLLSVKIKIAYTVTNIHIFVVNATVDLIGFKVVVKKLLSCQRILQTQLKTQQIQQTLQTILKN